MIGKKIKSFIDASGLKYFEVAKKLDISYQNLNRILNKESIETRYLFQFAEILEIPVTAFFEAESDKMFPSTYITQQNEKIKEYQKRIKDLEEQLEDKTLLIDFFKSKTRQFVFGDLVFKLGKIENGNFEIELSKDDFESLKNNLNYPEELKEFVFEQVKVKIQ